MKKSIFFLLVVFYMLSGCASIQRDFDPRTAKFPMQTFIPPEPGAAELKNGAKVFYVEDHEAPLVRLYIAFRGGSLYDPPEKAGLSEVAELAWRTGGVEGISPEQFDEAVENRGMQLSLSLGRDIGWGSVSMLSEDMDSGFELLAKLLFRPSFVEDKVSWAAKRIAERIRREVDDPETLAYREFRRAAYGGHPRGVIASVESVQTVERGDIIKFHEKLLNESSWIIGAVGDFDSKNLLQLLDEYFGDLPGGGTGFAQLPPPLDPKSATILIPKELPQSTIVWGRLGPSLESSERYGLELADYILGSGGFQSRLVSEIRSNRGLAYSVGSFYQALPNFGVVGAYSLSKTESTAEVLTLLRQSLDKAASEGLGGDEIAKAKEAIITRQVFRYEDPANMVKDRMSLLLNGLPADLWKNYTDKLLAVRNEDSIEACRAYFEGMKGIVVIVGNLAEEDLADAVVGPVEVLNIN